MMIEDRRLMTPRTAGYLSGSLVAGLIALAFLCACHPAPSQPASATPETAKTADDEDKAGVTLSADQVSKLGIAVQPAEAVEHRDEATGYGLVMNHDAIAQAAAELISAQATERLSRSSLARAQKLNGTPGAVSADVEETAAQRAQVDAAALTATEQKLSSLFGMNPPWKKDDAGGMVQALASGRVKLLRAIFPLGALPDDEPTTLRVTRIGSAKPASGWTTSAVWDAPADGGVPGRSFFALLKTAQAREGERVVVFAPVGAAISGVTVPTAAVLLNEGKYWCYVQKQPGVFQRVPVDTSMPVATGYFVKEGVAAGDGIVISAAALLLAKETGGAAEPD